MCRSRGAGFPARGGVGGALLPRGTDAPGDGCRGGRPPRGTAAPGDGCRGGAGKRGRGPGIRSGSASPPVPITARTT
ncbi:hypothetical protein BJY27_006898 [Streptomyces rapamycinicus]|uniref:Uncharacterized protein n=1 Tax=Streptomyces rapamycinicus TaxID=1226757 RepID=A0ABR6LUC2_9ACTN|nr:hypothetical protein [Streptomyces rapamycinicus]